jgi:hypothetical protein
MAAALSLLVPAGARADEGTHEKAASAFREGRQLIDQNNCEGAVSKLKESLRYESSIGARLSIADCVEKSDPLYAWKVLKEAAALSLMNHDDRLALAEQRAIALQSRLALLVFKLPPAADQAGFELRVDGDLMDRYLYRSGYAATPGAHVVEAIAPNHHFSRSVTADVGVQTPVSIELQADDCRNETHTASPASPAIEVDRGASRRNLGLAIGGIGVGAIATGVVFGLLTFDKKRSIEGACGGSVGRCNASPGSVDAETEAAKTTAALSTVSFAIGGAALLGGAALYFTAPSAGAPTAGVRLRPRAMKGGADLGLEGSW